MTTELIRPDLPAARHAFTDAIHALVGRTTTWLQRDPDTTEPNAVWGDSRYQQLLDYTPGGAGHRGASVARSVPPIAVDAITIRDTIDRTVRQWQPDAGTFDGNLADRADTPETVRRLHLLADHGWTPDDVPTLDTMTAKLTVWAQKIDDLLDPPRRWTLPSPCPACNTATVYRQDSAGETVRQPALQIGTHGCECMECRTFWDPTHFAFLARTLGTMPDGVLE